MAIDTRDKRASILGLVAGITLVLPNPDAAAETQGDRQQLAFSYPGILAGATVGPAYGLDDLTTMVSLYFADTLYAQAGYLHEDFRTYLNGVRASFDRNDLNSEVYDDLKT